MVVGELRGVVFWCCAGGLAAGGERFFFVGEFFGVRVQERVVGLAHDGDGGGELRLGARDGFLTVELQIGGDDAKAELSAAVSIVRQAYDTLLNPNAKEQTEEEKALDARRQAAGAAPEYYTQQLANYQAALARLGG